MKRIGCVIACIVLWCFFPPFAVSAEESYTYDDTLSSLLNASGAETLLEEEGMEDMLAEYDISISEPESLTSFSFRTLLEKLADEIGTALRAPLKTLALLTGVILFAAFVTSLQGSRSPLAELYEVICVLCAVGTIVQPLSQVFLQAADALQRSSGFMLSFSAIFGAVLTVSGGMTTAAGYQAVMVIICQIAMQLAANVMLPLLSMCIAMSIVDAANPAVSLDGIIKLIHKVTVWLLGFLMAVFLGLLSVQSMVALSTDKLASKTTKFVLSNAVPIVGGAVSDAYSTVLGSLGVLRSATGMVGVLSLFLLLTPMLVQLGIYRLLASAAAAVADLFDVGRVARLLKNMESVLSTAFSIAISFSIMLIVSTALMILLGSGLQA